MVLLDSDDEEPQGDSYGASGSKTVPDAVDTVPYTVDTQMVMEGLMEEERLCIASASDPLSPAPMKDLQNTPAEIVSPSSSHPTPLPKEPLFLEFSPPKEAPSWK